MKKTEQIVSKITEKIRLPEKPKIAIVLGTRLSSFLENVDDKQFFEFDELPAFPEVTGIGHLGRFVFGYIEGVPAIISDGRYHYYEGYGIKQTVLPIRVMHALGADILIETNIAGGINPQFSVGDIMMITDQINLLMESPLNGIFPLKRTDRFVDMSEAYDNSFCNIIRDCALALEMDLKEGTYIQVPGPNYETPAEVRFLHIVGADAVGMSTACEVIVAKQLDMKVCGLSYISNMGAGISKKKYTREEILKTAKEKNPIFFKLLKSIVREISSL